MTINQLASNPHFEIAVSEFVPVKSLTPSRTASLGLGARLQLRRGRVYRYTVQLAHADSELASLTRGAVAWQRYARNEQYAVWRNKRTCAASIALLSLS